MGAEAGLLSSILGDPGSAKSCEGHWRMKRGKKRKGRTRRIESEL